MKKVICFLFIFISLPCLCFSVFAKEIGSATAVLYLDNGHASSSYRVGFSSHEVTSFAKPEGFSETLDLVVAPGEFVARNDDEIWLFFQIASSSTELTFNIDLEVSPLSNGTKYIPWSVSWSRIENILGSGSLNVEKTDKTTENGNNHLYSFKKGTNDSGSIFSSTPLSIETESVIEHVEETGTYEGQITLKLAVE